MKKNIIATIMLLGFIIFCADIRAQESNQMPQSAEKLKSIYGISEADISEYLNDLKTNDLTTYNYIWETKSKNEEKFNELVVAGVLKKRMSGSSMPNSYGNELEYSKIVNRMKKIYNVTDKDVETTMNNISAQDPAKYERIKTLMKDKPYQAEAVLMQDIVYQRGKLSRSGVSNSLGNFVLQKEIRDKVENYKQTSDSYQKETLKKELRSMIGKSLDTYMEELEDYIENAKKMLQKTEQMRAEYIRDRQQKIEERLNFYLNQPPM